MKRNPLLGSKGISKYLSSWETRKIWDWAITVGTEVVAASEGGAWESSPRSEVEKEQ